MSTSNTNPFVLPGLGQDSDLSGNPLLASMEMMRKAWAGLAGPGGLAQSLPMAPPMNLDELERRIAELRTVESWLRMNLSMLSSAIQGMEVQRSTIATLRSFVAGAAGNGPSPLEVVLGLKPAQGAAPASASTGTSARSDSRSSSTTETPAPSADDAPAPPSGMDAASMADQMSQASQAWWNLLQQQFSQIATATASSMPDPAAMQAAAAAATQTATGTAPTPTTPAPAPASAPAARKRAPRKAAAKRAPAAPKP